MLKNVQEEDWARFKMEAASHGMKMPEFLSFVLREHVERERSKASQLEDILSWRSGLSSRNAEKIQKKISEFRHSFELKR